MFSTTKNFGSGWIRKSGIKKNCPMLTRIQHTDLAKGMLGQAKSTEKETYPFQARSSLVAAGLFGRFKQLEIFLKKVAERSRDSGRRSRDRRPTVKQRFLDVSSNLGKFWKKSLNGHATVVGGHATVGWLSNNVFWTFQAIWENFEKSRWTVTRQWSEVTRPSADCQTTFFGRFK